MLKLIKEKLIAFWKKDISKDPDRLDFTDSMLGTGDIPVFIDENNKIISGNIYKMKEYKKKMKELEKKMKELEKKIKDEDKNEKN